MSERLDEAAFELRALREERLVETPEQRMQRTNPSAWQRAIDMMNAVDNGALIEGYNASECYSGCGRAIEWRDVDLSSNGRCTVPDAVQPTGFQCRCENWCANECGDRTTRTCGQCITQATVA